MLTQLKKQGVPKECILRNSTHPFNFPCSNKFSDKISFLTDPKQKKLYRCCSHVKSKYMHFIADLMIAYRFVTISDTF